jgi:hypothetical protein
MNPIHKKLLILSSGTASDSNAPINTVAPAISGTLVVGNVLSCSTGTWTSDTGIIPPYTYQWYRGATLIVGETNNTYTLVALDMDENIKCVVTACDSDGCTNANSNTLLVPLFWVAGGSDVWGTATLNVYA